MFSIPGYNITKELYDNYKDIVYKGYKTDDNTPVIIKVLKPESVNTLSMAKFANEYEILKKMNFDGITKAYSLEQNNDYAAIILEDFNGVSVDNILSKVSTFDIKSFLDVAIKISSILGEIHKHNIIHKDIKPHNIILNTETGELKITDFGVAASYSSQSQELLNKNTFEGTAVYMSPEQTGRMNTIVDYRTDLYSLGITFYEMLTGKPPFESNDILQCIHFHIARNPTALYLINSSIPEQLSDIVMKLLSKNPMDRYKSAFGLRADLEKCRNQFDISGKIEKFPIGENDISDKFSISDNVYGREKELKLLVDTYENTRSGQFNTKLVKGTAGSGKTTLLKQLNNYVLKTGGNFISGKFEENYSNNNIMPFSAIKNAISELVKYILSLNEDKLEFWKNRAVETFASSGQAVIGLIPEMEIITGKQPTFLDIPCEQVTACNFDALRKCIRLFATPEMPLVLFLDDVQWIDDSSLILLKYFLEDKNPNFFLVLSFRDNEIYADNIFKKVIDILPENCIINIDNIDVESIHKLILDTICCSEDEAYAFSKISYEKTLGQPFFVKQFLCCCFDEGFIRFDSADNKWVCDLSSIEKMYITDNLATLMIEKIQKLNQETQYILSIAACIGTKFDLKTIVTLLDGCPFDTTKYLTQAIEEGLIIPLDNTNSILLNISGLKKDLLSDINSEYKFIHDRIKEAAYSLLTKSQKKELHFKIGMYWLKRTTKENLSDMVFEILSHLNSTPELLESEENIFEIAHLNLVAAQKAQSSTAFPAALSYIKAASALVKDIGWEINYAFTLDVFLKYAELEFINRNIDNSLEILNLITPKVKFRKDTLKILLQKIKIYSWYNKVEAAINASHDILNEYGIELTSDRNKMKALLKQEQDKAEIHFSKFNIDDVKKIKILCDDEIRYVLLVLNYLQDVLSKHAYDPYDFDLLIYIGVKTISMSFEHGISSVTANAFVGMATNIIETGNYDSAYKYGKLGLEISNMFEDLWIKSKVNFMFGNFVGYWFEHLDKQTALFSKGAEYGLNDGNLVMANSNSISYINTLFISGKNLDFILKEYQKHIDENPYNKKTLFITIPMIYSLRGESENRFSLTSKEFDEENFCLLQKSQHSANLLGMYEICKLMLYYIHSDYKSAYNYAVSINSDIKHLIGFICKTEYYFYYTLASLANFRELSTYDFIAAMQTIKNNLIMFEKWSQISKDNFMHKYLLLMAEYKKLEKDDIEAMKYYDLALEDSLKNKYINTAAIICECAGRFYKERGFNINAATYINKSYSLYKKWGCTEKLRLLIETYPDEIKLNTKVHNAKSSFSGTTSTTLEDSRLLDMMTVIKSSQAISKEILYENLLKNLMKICLESAGAEKGLIILNNDNSFKVEAICCVNDNYNSEIVSIPLDNCELLSKKVFNYVARTKENIVLNNALIDEIFCTDSYILKNKSKSILCIPIIYRKELIGILYFENNLVAGAFTNEHVEVLNTLSAQMAISIKNAAMYKEIQLLNADLEKKVELRTIELKDTINKLDITASGLKNLLDNAGQGFLSFGDNYIIDNEYSKECLKIFNLNSIEGEYLPQLIYPYDIEDRRFLEKTLFTIAHEEDKRKLQIYLSLLPTELTINNRIIKIEFKYINKFMIIMTDITETRNLENKMEQEKKTLKMVVKVISNLDDFYESVRDYRNFYKIKISSLLNENVIREQSIMELFREVHTFKGNFSQFWMINLPAKLHCFEQKIQNYIYTHKGTNYEDISSLLAEANFEEWLSADTIILKETIGEEFLNRENCVVIHSSKIIEIENKIISMFSPAQYKLLLPELRKLRYKDIKDLLKIYTDYVLKLSERLDKSIAPFEISGDTILIDPNKYHSFIKSLVHIFRNSIDHGIELPESRVLMGKNPCGQIECTVKLHKSNILLSISDDGNGIDREIIKTKALSKGFDTSKIPEENLIDLIFIDEFTTKDNVTELSGRGMGLSAVKMEAEKLGITISVETETQKGTRFIFTIPLDKMYSVSD